MLLLGFPKEETSSGKINKYFEKKFNRLNKVK